MSGFQRSVLVVNGFLVLFVVGLILNPFASAQIAKSGSGESAARLEGAIHNIL